MGLQGPALLQPRKAFTRTSCSSGSRRVGHAAGRRQQGLDRATRSTPVVCAAAVEAPALPWQTEIKKRPDIKSILIIGAGPIVIGQVRGSRLWGACEGAALGCRHPAALTLAPAASAGLRV